MTDDDDDKPPDLRRETTAAGHATFWKFYGIFHAAWGSLDLTVDVGIGQFLKLPAIETHLMTIGVDFGRRMQLLIQLAERSDRPNKAEIVRLAKDIQGNSRRNVFAHSFIVSNDHEVTFIYRDRNNPLEAKEYPYTIAEFQEHVLGFLQDAADFTTALGVKNTDLAEFAAAVIKKSRVTTFTASPGASTPQQ